jgi:hypothetical protein
MKETNMEHFRDDILKVLNEASCACMAVMGGVPIRCIDMDNCDECDLAPCNENKKIKWLLAEYKKPITLTAREKHFVEFAEDGWVARDEDGILGWFMRKPDKTIDGCASGSWGGAVHAFSFRKLNNLFKFITWEGEPWNIEDLRKLKALEHNPDDVAFKGGELND